MDSLDRTNVVQSLVALENLKHVLVELGIPHTNLRESDFYQVYQNVWANHANIIGNLQHIFFTNITFSQTDF